MIDFSISPEFTDMRARITEFMDTHVYRNEGRSIEHEGLPTDLERELQQQVKDQGLWAPNLPKEWGGMGIGYVGQALANEIIGRSIIAPRLFGSMAPDAGNAELLLVAATAEQKENYAAPLPATACNVESGPDRDGPGPT